MMRLPGVALVGVAPRAALPLAGSLVPQCSRAGAACACELGRPPAASGPGRSELHAPALAHEQVHAQVGLELPDPGGDIGLHADPRALWLRLSNRATPILGEWGLVIGTTSVHVAIGYYDAANHHWGILVDSSNSYYNLYTFQLTDFNRIEGNNYTYMKSSAPSGYLPFVGYRMKSASAAAGAPGPETGKSAMLDTDSAQFAKTAVALDGPNSICPWRRPSKR
jgi:hypothetical protein